MKVNHKLFFTIFVLLLGSQLKSQNKKAEITSSLVSEMKFRHIGPAFMSGRISDIALHPTKEHTWYITAGSGGVWKTENAGTTWKPIFEGQKSYSIGCITIDSSNPHILWLGTGENVGGRHVGFGDGVYKSTDDGVSWKNIGLKESQHISKIIVHPENSDIVWVAAQGNLWKEGGERGLYKSSDGGKTWGKSLGDEKYTGVTDIVIDPRNPDVLYAATWEKHRTVAAYMGGGKNSGIHKSIDGGKTWTKLSSGLPSSDMGKIGLAISPQNPDVVYAAVELLRRKGALYRSDNRGESWQKQSDAVSSATGPHYYQELYASPHEFDKIFLADVRVQVSENGGKTFSRMNEKDKHSDNHAIAFKKSDPNFLLIGTDGGLYVSYDASKTWQYISNLPLTQFYKIALDDSKPFYKIYGGTQDNNTQCGPSRTDDHNGITNADWEVVLYADGHQPATEPGNPNIVYAEWQEGNLVRIDKATGEVIHIQPQPFDSDDYERFNWDSPILVSPHSPSRIYYASQRVWRSDNRGDKWEAISGDLTKNENRFHLPLLGKTQSWDAAWDVYAMSNYNTITSLSESPVKEDLLYAGTDDGFICVKDGKNSEWKRIKVSELPSCPETAFVNDIKADLFDENTVYAVLDNHKFGDFKPYLYESNDRGESWKSISSNIPEKYLIWRIVQDYRKPDLMFIGTEFGLFFTTNKGEKWTQLKGGLPVIPVRDLAVHKEENDLVAATFGRGIYILDDYSPLRNLSEEKLSKKAFIFPVKDSWWYVKRPKLSFGTEHSQGNSLFIAENPPYGTVITYNLSESFKTKKAIRQEKEKNLVKEGKPVKVPSWEELAEELKEEPYKILVRIEDKDSNIVSQFEGKTGEGIHRVVWNMRYNGNSALGIQNEGNNALGFLVPPGKYTVQLFSFYKGETNTLSEKTEFVLKPLHKASLPEASVAKATAFWKEIADFNKDLSLSKIKFNRVVKKVDLMRTAASRAKKADNKLSNDLYKLSQKLTNMKYELYGNPARKEIGEQNKPNMQYWINMAISGTSKSTYGPTDTHKKCLQKAKDEHQKLNKELDKIINEIIPELEKGLNKINAPYIAD